MGDDDAVWSVHVYMLCDRFRYILGEFPLQAGTPTQAILQYQALCLKTTNCPFGVRVYGSVYEVSYSTVITVSSV